MSFRLKTILGVAAVEVVLLVILIAHSLSLLRDSNEDQLVKRAHSSTTLLATAVKDAVLATDLATLDALLKEVLDNPGVAYARVLNLDRTLSQRGQPALLARRFVADRAVGEVSDGIFDTFAPVSEDGFSYGRVEVGFSTASIASVLSRARRRVVLIAVLEIVLVAIFSAILGSLLTRRLSQLEDASRRVADGQFGIQVPMRGGDEMARAIQAFNIMSQRLCDSREEQRLVQSALRQAKEFAEVANHTKSRFLATMSHEIRTPLTGMLGAIGLLLDGDLGGDERLFVQTAHDAGQSLLSLINDVLDYAKIEAGKLELETADFELAEVVEGVSDLLAVRAHARLVELATCIDGSVPARVHGDASRLRQVLLNLVGNGVKFTEAGGVALTVGAESRGPGRVRLGFLVEDTGIGISPEKRQAIFEEFTQADSSDTRAHGGTGLGLAIASRLVKLMGGDIAVDSGASEGSRFSFTIELPVATASGAAAQWVLPAEAAVPRVLLCEPNPVARAIVGRQLDELSVRAVCVANAQQALAHLPGGASGRSADDGAGTGPDLGFGVVVVADSLPDMTLGQFVSKLGEVPDAYRPEYLVVAARRGVAGVSHRELAQVDAVLTKPIQRRALVDLIRQLRGPSAASRPTARAITGRTPAPTLSESVRVLLAEDNQILQLVTTRILKRANCRVDVVSNGLEAIAAVSQWPYDLVLMDLSMPGADGLEATRQIRQLPGAASQIPIVALTANVADGERERCYAAGMNDYLTKPIDVAALLNSIERLCDHVTVSQPSLG